MKKIAITIAAALALSFSCDRYTMFTMTIDNQTDETIEIFFLEKSPYETLTQLANINLYQFENEILV